MLCFYSPSFPFLSSPWFYSQVRLFPAIYKSFFWGESTGIVWERLVQAFPTPGLWAACSWHSSHCSHPLPCAIMGDSASGAQLSLSSSQTVCVPSALPRLENGRWLGTAQCWLLTFTSITHSQLHQTPHVLHVSCESPLAENSAVIASTNISTYFIIVWMKKECSTKKGEMSTFFIKTSNMALISL